MKVLFAVSNDGVTTSVVQKYQQKYKEIITKKSVYYFNAIIKELQRDRTYDAIVIGEDLEPLANNDYAQADKFIFEKLDEISDEASKSSGEDIPIIFICADRRTREDALLIKMFGIGVYNALVENDRSIEKVCELICKPRSKKEAKSYYKLEGGDVSYSPASDSEIDEAQVQNILNYFAKVGNNEQKIVQTFDHIADQYTETQLRLIVNVLPLPVKATLESSSPRYQKLMNGGTVLSNGEYQQYSKNDPKKPTPLDAVTVIDITDSRTNKRKEAAQVVIPSSMNFENSSGMEINDVNSYNNQRKNFNMNENENLNQNPNMSQNSGVVTPNQYQSPYGNPYANPYGQPMYNNGQMPPMGGMPGQMPMGGYSPMPGMNPQMPQGPMPVQPMPNQQPYNGQMPMGQPMNQQPMNQPINQPMTQTNPNTNVDQNGNNQVQNPIQAPGAQNGQVPYGAPAPMPGTMPNNGPAMEPTMPVQDNTMPDSIPMPQEETAETPASDVNPIPDTNLFESTSEPMNGETNEFTPVPTADEVPQTDMQSLPGEGSPFISDTNPGDAFISDPVANSSISEQSNNETTVNFDSLNASDSEGPLPGFETVDEDEKKDDEGVLPGFEEVNPTDTFTPVESEPQIEQSVNQEPEQTETTSETQMDPMANPMQGPAVPPMGGPVNPQINQGPAPMQPMYNNGPMPGVQPVNPQMPQMPQTPNTAFDPNYMPNADYGQASTYRPGPAMNNNYGNPQPMNAPMPNNNFGQPTPMAPNMMPNPNGQAPTGNGDGAPLDSGSTDDGSGVLSNQ